MMISNIELTHPAWLWLLVGFALTAFILKRYQKNQDDETRLENLSVLPGRGNIRHKHPLFFLLKQSTKTGPRPHRVPKNWWQWVVLTCLVLALTQPVRTGKVLPEPPQRRDIVFIVDASVSMILRDYLLDGQRIDRMTLLKSVLNRFVDGLHGDRLSVIVYADQAYTMVPPTRDHNLVKTMLSRIKTGVAGRSNAMGDAIALAVKHAGKDPQRRRVLILFSSGARPTGEVTPEDIAALAAEMKLTLYSIAIGAGNATAEEQRIAGLIYDPADFARLENLAKTTGGRFFPTGDAESLTKAIADVAKIETNPVKPPPRHERRTLYQWPLAAGLLLLTLVQLSRVFAQGRTQLRTQRRRPS